MALPKKLIVILLWGIFSYLLSQLILDVEITQKGFFILLVCAGLWMTEIIPLPATALLGSSSCIFYWEFLVRKQRWPPFQIQSCIYLWVDLP